MEMNHVSCNIRDVSIQVPLSVKLRSLSIAFQKAHLFIALLLIPYKDISRVCMGYGNLCKLIIPFSRTWKVRGEVFQNNYENFLDFCLQKF